MQHLLCGTLGKEDWGTVLDEANVQHPSPSPFLTAAAGPPLHRATRRGGGGVMGWGYPAPPYEHHCRARTPTHTHTL